MKAQEKKEERNKRIGWIAAVAIQLVLLVFFYFLIAWRAPNPPIPEYGIELGFSTSAGAPSSTPSPESAEEQIDDAEIQSEEESVVEDFAEFDTEESLEVETETEVVEEVVVDEIESPIKVEEAEAAEEIVTEIDSPIKVGETEMEPTESELVEETPEAVKPEEESVEVIKEEKLDQQVPVEKIVEEIDMGEGLGEEAEEPVIDQRSIYGSQGASEGNDEGPSLSLAGWAWDFQPNPDDKSEETGKITFKIVVDSDGLIVKIEEVNGSTISPAVARKYRQAVEKLTFSKTIDYKTAQFSTGTVTFIIKSK